jgi:probable F420-dependent oxidoreductase
MYPPSEQYRLLEVAKRADELGVDSIDVIDHVLMGEGALASGMGWEPHHLEMPIVEPLTTLAAMAGITRRITLISAVVISPLRPAGLLAKMGATLHALSHGRFVMGVSVSWHKDEYDALGVPFDRRGQVLDDQLAACRVLWREAPASFHSPTVNFDAMYCSPRPATTERIPIWFGGHFTPRLVRRVTTLGDGWLLYAGLGMSLAQKADAIAELKQKFAAAGRDPTTELELCDEVEPLQGDLERSMEHIPRLAEAGITTVRVHLRRFSSAPDDVLATLEDAVSRFEQFKSVEV